MLQARIRGHMTSNAQFKNLKASYGRVQNLQSSLKLCKRVTPRGKFITKIRNVDSFVGCISTFVPQKNVKFGTRERTFSPLSPSPNSTFIGVTSTYSGLLSENNTGMAALRAGLPVMKHYIILLVIII